MSIQSQVDRLNTIKERIRTNLVAQGIAVPADAMLEEMATQILSVAGEPGPRGAGLLPVTTAPSSYTTAVNGLTPAYRISLSTVKSQASTTEVFAGDTVRHSYYHYPVIYVDSSYVYCGARVSIRGATGAAGSDATVTAANIKSALGYTPADQEDVDALSAGKADKFDPTAYRLPILYLTGSTNGMTKETEVALSYECKDKNGTVKTGSCTMKWQGSSSLAYEKKNYTIKFDNAFEVVDGWGSQKKYCLKANFIDTTHARNIVTAKLWGQMTKSRSSTPAEWTSLPNAGAVDGFPIIIMLNGEFHGLYTWNIPKDGWMFGFAEDTTKTQAIVCANKESVPVMFKAEAALDGSDFEIEFISDETNTAWAKTSLNRLIKACMNTTGSDLDTTVAQYLDWDSAIDHYILTVLLGGSDILDKNFLLVTKDGTKWYFSAYDLDTTYGLKWDGSGLRGYDYAISFDECAVQHRVYELIKRFKTDALKARYKQLRSGIWGEANVCQTFENFAWIIPSPVMNEDVKKHPTILGSSVNDIDQVCRWVHKRLEIVDSWANALPAQEEPVAPVEVINWVERAIDTDGSIYNGTGYKDDVRLSSSGGVSSSAQNGSVTTGFIPWTSLGVIRMKGAQWIGMSEAHSATHWYVIFYDGNKAIYKTAITSSAYDSGTYDSANIHFTYDETTGITTFDFSNSTNGTNIGDAARNAAYFRINAYGKGADLIVTVNQEITV